MKTYPHLVGFENIFNLFDSLSNEPYVGSTFPPHNVIKVDDTKSIIELAVAGYGKNDIDVKVEKRTLTLVGDKGTDEKSYVHKGISSKKFTKEFTLAEHVKVTGADLEDGMLLVYIEREVPEEERPKTIEIGGSNPKALNG